MSETATAMKTGEVFPLGVCVWPPPAPNRARTFLDAPYVHEILRHAGLCYSTVAPKQLAEQLQQLRILVTIGETDLAADLGEQLSSWVENGGVWLSVSGVCGLAELFGAVIDAPPFQGFGVGVSTLGEGYLQTQSEHPAVAHLQKPLHFFNGLAVRTTVDVDCVAQVLDAHGRATERAAILEKRVGKGRCLLIAPDLTGTVVRVQQGTAVTRDGVSAPDGSAPTADGVLKSDDGMVLDWILDRDPIPDVPGLQGFLHPIADEWREVLLRTIFHLAGQQNVQLPLLWLYPRALPAVAHISLDTDHNDPGQAQRTLENLAAVNAPATWCTILPGYDAELTAQIRNEGHELAMHFDAMSDGLPWTEASFDRQWRELSALFDGQAPLTNKNHYLRWEGDTELFEWCQKRGIQMDQSKGTSKSGEAGFNFGTCHPFFPLDPAGAIIDVLELPTPTQDLTVFVPFALLHPLLQAARRHHGVLHLLFHPAHIDKPGMAQAMRDSVTQARECGLEWWTARQLNDWERARRQTRWISSENGCTLQTQAPLPEATILWLDAHENAQRAVVNGEECETQVVERWGCRFLAVALDAAEPGAYQLELHEI